jgi:hypothetical protein
MRTIYILAILVLLALAVPAAPAQAGGVVTVCDEAHLLAALAGGGTVTFACSGTITLTNTITIAADTTIDGSGQSVTISGNSAVQVFKVNAGITFNLNELTVANGYAGMGTAGGGVYNLSGTVNVSHCTFFGNSARNAGGGIFNSQGIVVVSNSTFSANSATNSGGGGIDNYHGTVSISSSTFSENDAPSGGGIDNIEGTLTVSASTFSGNSSSDSGGGIKNQFGTVTVSNSTFVGNSATNGGGIYNLFGSQSNVTVSNSTFSGNSATSGSGIYNLSTGVATLKNSIIANSITGNSCHGAITDGGGNLSYPDTTCPGINADPALGPLQNNGGPTWTMALGPGGAAIDAANDATCAAAPVNGFDQRGIIRPQGPHCDIGAVEQVPPMPPRIWLPLVHWW